MLYSLLSSGGQESTLCSWGFLDFVGCSSLIVLDFCLKDVLLPYIFLYCLPL